MGRTLMSSERPIIPAIFAPQLAYRTGIPGFGRRIPTSAPSTRRPAHRAGLCEHLAVFSLVLGLAACGTRASSNPQAVSVVAASASAGRAVVPVDAGLPHPAPGKVGWFSVPAPQTVESVRLSNGQCVAVLQSNSLRPSDRWLVTVHKDPNDPHPTPCDGDPAPIAPCESAVCIPVGRFGDGAVYRDGDHISVSPSPSANLQKITDSALSPIREAAVTATEARPPLPHIPAWCRVPRHVRGTRPPTG